MRPATKKKHSVLIPEKLNKWNLATENKNKDNFLNSLHWIYLTSISRTSFQKEIQLMLIVTEYQQLQLFKNTINLCKMDQKLPLQLWNLLLV